MSSGRVWKLRWQTLLQNQAAKVLSLEETAQTVPAPGSQTIASHRGDVPRQDFIIKGFTDPDLLDIESHSPTLTREGFMTVLQYVCSHGHKLAVRRCTAGIKYWRPDQAERTTLRLNAA